MVPAQDKLSGMPLKPYTFVFIATMNGDSWGGSEQWWYTMALYLSKAGHHVTCCYFNWPGKKESITNALHDAGCTTILLPNPKYSKNPIQKILLNIKARKIITASVTQNPDLVIISLGGYEDFTHSPFHNLLPFLKKFIIVAHNYNESAKLSSSRKRSIENWYNKSALNLLASEKINTALQKVAGFSIPNAVTLINPINITLEQQPFAWPSLTKNGNYQWVMMAQLDKRRKAQDLLIKALASNKWKDRNWELALYGEGADFEKLQQLIETLQLSNKIKLMGKTNAVKNVLAQAHLLLQITPIDAMPLSVTEAMSMARPCVISAVGDMPVWITENNNGFIAPLVSVASIDTVLEKAWQQKDQWQLMGEAAFHTFKSKYPQPYEAHFEQMFIDIIN
ncbi:MAG: glycosyltransferase [Ferruginibacter sp.]